MTTTKTAKTPGTVAPKPKGVFQNLLALQQTLTDAMATLKLHLQEFGCKYLNAGCFAAGTPLWTPGGYRAIETLVPGELVYSRDEGNPAAPVEAKVVEEVFTRYAGVYHLHIGGQVIGTSGEHPFYVAGRGWTAANELRVDDGVLCADGTTVRVEEVSDTGEWEVVYNLRVADHHTYFVGEESWGWCAWAHNAYASPVNGTTGHAYPATADTAEKQADYRVLIGASAYTEYRRKHLQAKTIDKAIQYSSNGGDSQYVPCFSKTNTNNGLEKTALMHGFIVEHGGSYHAFIKFDRVVGYDSGNPTSWIRSEVARSAPYTRHGHPMSESRLPQAVKDHFGI